MRRQVVERNRFAPAVALRRDRTENFRLELCLVQLLIRVTVSDRRYSLVVLAELNRQRRKNLFSVDDPRRARLNPDVVTLDHITAAGTVCLIVALDVARRS